MTLQEVIKELRGNKKIYHEAGLKQAYFSEMLTKIENGLCKHSTTVRFLELFGYEIDREILWKRK